MNEDSGGPHQNREQGRENDEPLPTGEQEPNEPSGDGVFSAVSDIDEAPGETVASASSFQHTSDALYIVREANYLLELDEALEEAQIELKEELA